MSAFCKVWFIIWQFRKIEVYKMKPLISIIIPVYNTEKYIRRCIDSVIAQSYKEWELILVDDGSTDKSGEICDEYAEKDERIRVFHKTNGGASSARNVGLDNATGDWVYFCDSDDELPLNAMSLFAAEVEKHPGVDMVMGYMKPSKEYSWYNLGEFKGHQYVTDREYLQYKLFYDGFRIPVNAANKLVRKDFIVENDLYFMQGIIHEDNQWFFHVLKCIGSFAFIFEPTYFRYWNDNSVTSIASADSKVYARSWHIILLDFTNNLYGPFKKLQLYKYALSYADLRMNRYHFPNDRRLKNNIVKNAFREGMFTMLLLFVLWCCLDSIGIRRGPIRLMNPVRRMYHNESMKYIDKYK